MGVRVVRQADRKASEAASGGRRRMHPILAGMGITLGGQVAVALCTVLLYRLLVQELIEEWVDHVGMVAAPSKARRTIPASSSAARSTSSFTIR